MVLLILKNGDIFILGLASVSSSFSFLVDFKLVGATSSKARRGNSMSVRKEMLVSPKH